MHYIRDTDFFKSTKQSEVEERRLKNNNIHIKIYNLRIDGECTVNHVWSHNQQTHEQKYD